MATLHDSLVVARSAILAHQERLHVASNNIANVNTPGYRRERVVLGNNPYIEPTLHEHRDYPISTGVTVTNVVRSYNDMKETILREQTQNATYHENIAAHLGELEAMMASSGDAALNHQLQQFWSAWQDVANNAESLVFRSVLIERGAALAAQISTMDTNMESYKDNLIRGTAPNFDGIIQEQVTEINTIAAELQDLNYRIGYAVSQFEPHDLMNRRDILLRELSELADITLTADYEIQISGETLVIGETLSTSATTHNTLTINAIDNAPPPAVDFTLDGSNITINGSAVGALVDVVDTINAMGLRLDELAHNLAVEVYNLHFNGYDLDGNTGIPFFTGVDNDGDGLLDADTLIVDPNIHDPNNPMNDNPRAIAAATVTNAVGDGSNALAIADLAYKQVPGLNGYTFGDFFTSQLGTLGSQAQAESDLAENGRSIIEMLNNSIEAESGVNLDEEMIELVSAQRAYQIAVKLFTTIDEMFDLIINRM